MTKTLEVSLDRATVIALYEALGAALGDANGKSISAPLDDDDPRWNHHSGGTGHSGPEWTAGDLNEAIDFYGYLRNKARVFTDLLIDHPGVVLTVDDLCELSADTFTGPSSVAGAIKGLRKPKVVSGRRYPFYWWAGSPTGYAMKPSVAALFRKARAESQGG